MSLGTQFEHELKKRINDRLVEIAEILCDGQAIKDYADYKKWVGEFQSLKRVADVYCDEVNKTINQR